jgi:ABC-type phosphate transport system substrate-binding protein
MKTFAFNLRCRLGRAPGKLVAILPVTLLVVLAGSNANAQISLTGAGATFPYPMYSKWFDEYHKLHPDIQINYQYCREELFRRRH